MKIIKIGGSALTDKRNGDNHVAEVADRVARELIPNERYVIVHGVGYVGHKLAKEYKLFKGLQSNHIQWAYLRSEVAKITKVIVEALVEHGHPAVEVSITDVARARNGEFIHFNLNCLKRFVDMGFIPVLRGDGVIDESSGLTVISGDKIATELALRLGADEIIYGTDVDGLLDEKGMVIGRIRKDEARSLPLWDIGDFSGGMKNKLLEALRLKDAKIRIINLRKDGNLKLALEGRDVGTLILP